MTDSIRLYLSLGLMGLGVLVSAISILGVFRFRFVMNRMHCAAVLDTLGMGCILCGLMVMTGSLTYIPKLLAALVILWIGSPLASHLVGRMELTTDKTAQDHITREEE